MCWRVPRGSIESFRPVLYIENEFPDRSTALLTALFDLGYDAWWHTVACFNPSNFRGRTDDIFGNASCVNMFCTPREAAATIQGLRVLVRSMSIHARRHEPALRTVNDTWPVS